MNQIQVRPTRPDDATGVTELVAGLSPRSAFLRFFAGVGSPSPGLVRTLLRRDAEHGAWVGTVGAAGTGAALVGHASWGRVDDDAEIGVVVADAWQRRGLGGALLAAVLREVAGRGLTGVRMHVHAENRTLVRRLSAGAPRVTLEDGVVVVTRPLADLLGRLEPSERVA